MSKRVWMVQETKVWGPDLVEAYANKQAAMSRALELVVSWEERSGQPVETKARGLHKWSWPSEGRWERDFTVLLIQTPILHW